MMASTVKHSNGHLRKGNRRRQQDHGETKDLTNTTMAEHGLKFGKFPSCSLQNNNIKALIFANFWEWEPRRKFFHFTIGTGTFP